MIGKFFIGLLLTFAFIGFAHAKTPTEVLTPYKAYKSALADGNFETARDQAYEAWRKAEKLLGDTRITGDLAFNYATIPPEKQNSDGTISAAYRASKKHGVSTKTYKRIEEAFSESIKLAHFHEDMGAEVEVQRRITSFAFDLTRARISNGKFVTRADTTDLYKLEKAIEGFGLIGTTYEAELNALRSQYYQIQGEDRKALEYSDKALTLFQVADDALPSAYPYVVKLVRAKSLEKLGDRLPAALQFQDVMQNLEGQLDAEHPFVNQAFSRWIWLRNEIERDGELEKAEEAGLCKCWPFNEYINKAVPAIRIPPIMPRRAKRSGHVIINYDVDDEGIPYNITEVSSSSKVFVEAALKSVEAWRHVNVADETHADFNPDSRKNITSTITFLLSDESGRIIPE